MMSDRGNDPREMEDDGLPDDWTFEGVRPLTRELVEALMMDAWPSPAACIDFGITSPEHLGALQFAVKAGGVTPAQLDAALGNGAALQALIGPQNPYGTAVFKTDWDDLPDEPAEF